MRRTRFAVFGATFVLLLVVGVSFRIWIKPRIELYDYLDESWGEFTNVRGYSDYGGRAIAFSHAGEPPVKRIVEELDLTPGIRPGNITELADGVMQRAGYTPWAYRRFFDMADQFSGVGFCFYAGKNRSVIVVIPY